LDGEPQWAARFRDGAFATLYLAPFNYHRVHMPLEGALRAAWYVPGLFARNERLVLVFEDEALCFALILVGALFVGSISTVWHGQVTPAAQRRRGELAVTPGQRLARGAELGRFNMGSTVILLLPPATADWSGGLVPGAEVRVGRRIGTRV
ncbi:MAG: phosphatidylserine decarboxylase, partial [Gammaproteobacteria bacterium]|nr:phosphatidylserine decarboxylase [Gammaproteobacteria bacterium]